jgi:hypothetical protein
MTRFQMTRRFLTPRVFEGPNLWERAIKGYHFQAKFFNNLISTTEMIQKSSFDPENSDPCDMYKSSKYLQNNNKMIDL